MTAWPLASSDATTDGQSIPEIRGAIAAVLLLIVDGLAPQTGFVFPKTRIDHAADAGGEYRTVGRRDIAVRAQPGPARRARSVMPDQSRAAIASAVAIQAPPTSGTLGNAR